MSFRMTITGDQKLLVKLMQAPVVLQQMDKEIQDAGVEILNRASRNAPVDTGTLRASLSPGAPKTISRKGKLSKATGRMVTSGESMTGGIWKHKPLEVTLGTGVKYAAVQEYPNRRAKKPFYFKRAVESMRRPLQTQLNKIIRAWSVK